MTPAARGPRSCYRSVRMRTRPAFAALVRSPLAFAARGPLAIAALSGALACTPPPPSAGDPAEAVKSFSRALEQGDTQSAWALLSTRTQERADALALKARVSADGGPESGRAMLFSGALPLGTPDAKVLDNDGSAARVSVSLDGGTPREYRVVREGAGWRLELNLD